MTKRGYRKFAGLNRCLRLLNDGWSIESVWLPDGSNHNYITHERSSLVEFVDDWEFDFFISSKFIKLEDTRHLGRVTVKTWRKDSEYKG